MERKYAVRMSGLAGRGLLILLLALTGLSSYLPSVGHAASSGPSTGVIPWHPHLAVSFATGLGASVDLADGHLDVTAADLTAKLFGRPFSVVHTWDSTAAQAGTSTVAGQGWFTGFTAGMSGAPGSTVTYTAADGGQWVFPYSNGAYVAPPGTPWSLTASGSGYTLTNIRTGTVSSFNSSGQLTQTADSYGNTAAVTWSGSLPTVWGPLTLTTSGGLLAKVYSTLGRPVGADATSYAYTSGRLTTQTRAGSFVAHFAYTGNNLTTLTTPGSHAWTLGYTNNQLTAITSPISGTIGQLGYTPAITTTVSYQSGQTIVVAGAGSTQPITPPTPSIPPGRPPPSPMPWAIPATSPMTAIMMC